MKIKVFTKDANGNISITKKELEDLLTESYWDGYQSAKNTTTITYPLNNWKPYCTSATNNLDTNSITISSNTINYKDMAVPCDNVPDLNIKLGELNAACDLEAAMRASE